MQILSPGVRKRHNNKPRRSNLVSNSNDLVLFARSASNNFRMDPANILVARLGSRINAESMNRFFQRLLQSETLPGF
jgi:hypothetical protein